MGLEVCHKWNNRAELTKQRQLKHSKLQKKWKKEQRDLVKKIAEYENHTQLHAQLVSSGGVPPAAPPPLPAAAEPEAEPEAEPASEQGGDAATTPATSPTPPNFDLPPHPASLPPPPSSAFPPPISAEAAATAPNPNRASGSAMGALDFSNSAPLGLQPAAAPPPIPADSTAVKLIKDSKNTQERLQQNVKNCRKRIETNRREEERLLATNREEDTLTMVLAAFFLEAKRLVWQPRTPENTRLSMPSEKGELSANMKVVMDKANKLGISKCVRDAK